MGKKRKRKSNSIIKEWGKALVLALILAITVRNFVAQSFVVSSTKMEKTLLIGDYVLVNKTKFGARFPITLLSIPFANELYTQIIQLPYFRLPGFGNIENNDLVVLNYPALRNAPIDKRQTIIKRCVALPGDTLSIENKKVFVNTIKQPFPEKVQFSYRIVTNENEIDNTLLEKYDITEGGKVSDIGIYDFPLDENRAESILQESNIRYVSELKDFPGDNTTMAFPNSQLCIWNKDYFGPIIIPFAGQTIELNPVSYALYKDLIEIYENNTLIKKGLVFYVNGTASTNYTIKSNYYFVMDDNRDNAKDSRTWGFVPESHIIGNTSFIWFSFNKQKREIRWDRIFKALN